MPKFRVCVVGFKKVRVYGEAIIEAETADEAEDKAHDEVTLHEVKTYDSDYDIIVAEVAE